MPYQISIKKAAIKALEKLQEPFYSSIKEAIYDLAQNPRPAGCKKLTARNGYRIRVGQYRIIYEIQDSILFIEVIDIGHRKEIYRD